MVEFRTHKGTGKPYPITKGTGVYVPNMPEYKDALSDYYEKKAFSVKQPPQIGRILKEIAEDATLSIDERKMLASSILARAYYYNIRRFAQPAGNPELDMINMLNGQRMLMQFQADEIINGIDRQWVIDRLQKDGLIMSVFGREGMSV